MILSLLPLVLLGSAEVDSACRPVKLVSEDSKLWVLGRDGAKVHSLTGAEAWELEQGKLGRSLLLSFDSATELSSVALWGAVGSFRLSYLRDESETGEWRSLDGAFRLGESGATTPHLYAKSVRLEPLALAASRARLRVQAWGCAQTRPCLRLWGEGGGEVAHAATRTMGELSLGFRARQSDGVLLSAVSDAEHALLAQMRGSRVELVFALGWGEPLILQSRAGLDDGRWHRLELRLRQYSAQLLVEGRPEDEARLPPFRVPNIQPLKLRLGAPELVYPLLDWTVKGNWDGCLEDVQWEGEALLPSLESAAQPPLGLAHITCAQNWDAADGVVSLTDAWLSKKISPRRGLRLTLEFRTLSLDGALLTVPLLRGPIQRILLSINESRLQLSLPGLDGAEEGLRDLFSASLGVSDGGWHRLEVQESAKGLLFTVDQGQEDVELVTAALSLPTPTDRLVLGGQGFRGCFRRLSFDSARLSLTAADEGEGKRSYGRCDLVNGCAKKPCLAGACSPTDGSGGFACQCSEGREGVDCGQTSLPHSCAEAWDWVGEEPAKVTLDLDGPGPLPAFPAACHRDAESGAVVSSVAHDALEPIEARGFHHRGSFHRRLEYEGGRRSVEALVDGSRACHQETSMECFGGAALMSGGPWSWWTGKGGVRTEAWGGAPSFSAACTCHQSGGCLDGKRCNCDAGRDEARDQGKVTDLDFIPLSRVFLGDTGAKGKALRLSVAPLSCSHHRWDQSVTFSSRRSSLPVPTSSSESHLSFSLEFRTARRAGMLLFAESEGHCEWLKLYVTGGSRLVAEIAAGGSVHKWEVGSGANGSLDDDAWHSVHLSATRREARLVLDHRWAEPGLVRPSGELILPSLKAAWFLGGAGDASGFAGALRRVQLNGDLPLDMASLVKGNDVDVSAGLVGKCADESCANGGRCVERYDAFDCDCSGTGFAGALCLTGLGAELRGGEWAELSLTKREALGWDGSFRLGFRTTHPPAGPVHLISGLTAFADTALNLTLDAFGQLALSLRTAEAEEEVLVDDRRNLADGTFHSVAIAQGEADTVLQVDYAEPLRIRGLRLNLTGKSSFWSLGSAGFRGCLSGLRLGSAAAPLEMLLTDPARVVVQGSAEGRLPSDDLCDASLPDRLAEQVAREGLVGRPEEALEDSGLRLSVSAIRAADYRQLWLGLGLGGAVLGLCCLWLALRWASARQGGVYKTHEGEPELYLSPDNSHTALMGHKREWFI